jgi:cyclohexa-1,5-dienecarbonyl-CoA hydratase
MQELEWKAVRAEQLDDGHLLRLVLDCGKGNVLDREAIGALREAAAALGRAPGLRAIVIDHAGKHFSYGASVEEHLPGKVEQMLPELHALARELLELDVPLLAAVRGLCLGGGLELALLADRIFASPSARFGQPETNLGVFAPIGSLLLPRVVGPCHAADLLLSGRTVGVEEALGMGLAAELSGEPGDAALRWAREHLLPKSAAALRHATRALRFSWQSSFLEQLALLEASYLGDLMATHDAREGLAAFVQKREARWEDR